MDSTISKQIFKSKTKKNCECIEEENVLYRSHVEKFSFSNLFFIFNTHLKLQIKWWRGEREWVGCPRHAPTAFGDLVPCPKVPRQCSERVLAALLLPADFSNFARRANTTSFLFISLWPWKFAKSVVAFVTLYPLIKTVFICRLHCVVFYLESYFSVDTLLYGPCVGTITVVPAFHLHHV